MHPTGFDDFLILMPSFFLILILIPSVSIHITDLCDAVPTVSGLAPGGIHCASRGGPSGGRRGAAVVAPRRSAASCKVFFGGLR